MNTLFILFLGLLLDGLIGEPKWLWSRITHPIIIIGRAIDALDKNFNDDINRTPLNQRINGVVVLVFLLAMGGVLGFGAQKLPAPFHILIIAILIAQASLCAHVNAVAKALSRGDVAGARQKVSEIVGRDTQEMTPPDISRAAIESGAENLCDGVIAPVFWFLIAGLPGLLIYKIINTADSMIGYKTPRYVNFGWAVARFDDGLNWVPARLSALFLAIIFRLRTHARAICKDAQKHRSPNAGWPEAAMAFGLGVALSGPRRYDGRLNDEPFVNPQGKAPDHRDIKRAVYALWGVWGALMAIILIFALLRGSA